MFINKNAHFDISNLFPVKTDRIDVEYHSPKPVQKDAILVVAKGSLKKLSAKNSYRKIASNIVVCATLQEAFSRFIENTSKWHALALHIDDEIDFSQLAEFVADVREAKNDLPIALVSRFVHAPEALTEVYAEDIGDAIVPMASSSVELRNALGAAFTANKNRFGRAPYVLNAKIDPEISVA